MSRIAVLAVGAALLANSAVLAGEEKPQLGETEASVSGCRFLGQKDMIALIAADLDTLSISRAKGTRYLTLTASRVYLRERESHGGVSPRRD